MCGSACRRARPPSRLPRSATCSPDPGPSADRARRWPERVKMRSPAAQTLVIPKKEAHMSTIDARHLTERKAFAEPDEVREFPYGRAEILRVGGGEVGRYVFE